MLTEPVKTPAPLFLPCVWPRRIQKPEVLARSYPPLQPALVGAKPMASLISAFRQRVNSHTFFSFLDQNMCPAPTPFPTATSPSAKRCVPPAMAVSVNLKTDRCHIRSRMSHFSLVPQNLHHFDQLL